MPENNETSAETPEPVQETQLLEEQKGEPAADTHQTRINKMVMDGFKSFGKRTELIFDGEFNVVVGPNGSGKSNVIDALCFVLGKTSAKGMRAENTSNLIYNGGKTKNPAKQAEVSIYLDNSKKLLPLPDEEIKITRIAQRNGQSKYKINNKTVTRQEILSLLNFINIDPDGYNIILQGDIVHFCVMPSTERRLIVEEIAGISVYEEKKQKAFNDLEKVEDHLNQVAIILKEREHYLKDLKKDRDQAVKFKELNDSLKTNKATLLKRDFDKKKSAYDGLEKRIGTHREKFDKIQSQIKELRERIKSNREGIQQIDNEVQHKGEEEQVSMQNEIENLRIQLAEMKTKLSAMHTEIGRTTQRKDQLVRAEEELAEKIGETQQKKKDLVERKKTLESETKSHEERVAEFKKKHHLGEESVGIENQMLELDRLAEEKQKTLSELREKQQNLFREKDKIEFQLETMDQQMMKVRGLEKEHEQEIKSLKQKKEEFKKAVLELNQVLNNDSKLAAELAQQRHRLLKLSEELARLEVQQASQEEAAAGNMAVKKVLESRQKLGGVHGTIAELGNTDKKHSFALEISAANRINSIVVDDDRTAAKCIKFLKTGKFGTASFLPMNKIQGKQISAADKKIAQNKGVIGFAIDLIKFEPQYKEVFSYVFGNTLIVDSIDTARSIGIGNARMVTIDGDLCETSGAMIGGYHAKKKGAFKEQDTVKELEIIHSEVSMLQSKTSELQSQRDLNEKKIVQLREFKANVEGEIIKTEKSLHLDTSDLDASKDYKKELTRKLTEVSKELDTLTDSASEATRELAQHKTKKQELHSKIAELRKPTVIAELNAYEEHRRKLADEKIQVNVELKNVEEQLGETLLKEKENTAKIINDLDSEAADFKNQATEMDSSIKANEKELKHKEKTQAEFKSKFKNLFLKRNKISDEITAMENKVFTIEDTGRKEELQINTHSIEEARAKAELAVVQAELEQYSGVEIDDRKSDEQLRKEIKEAEKLRENIGSVNMRALEIYDGVQKEYEVLVGKKNTLASEKETIVEFMNEIESKKKEIFLKTLAVIKKNFQEIFSSLSTKGEADLEVENPENPFEGGLNVKVRLTGNKFLDIRSLSGGEKTLTALAFIFSIQEHSPASFYVLDEVDAALDKHNSDKLAKLVKKYSDRAQYIVISHNDAVISESATLYGVSMGDHGLSKVVSLKI